MALEEVLDCSVLVGPIVDLHPALVGQGSNIPQNRLRGGGQPGRARFVTVRALRCNAF
jgi:hypothetical protein